MPKPVSRTRVLYINNRYRQYDRRKYRVLAGLFDLQVLWINPAPPDTPLPAELAGAFRREVLDPLREDIIRPTQFLRSLRLFLRVARLARSADLVISSTSDSWKSKLAYLAARLRGTPILLRKEKWVDVPMAARGGRRLNARVQGRLTRLIELGADGMLPCGSAAAAYLRARGVPPERIRVFYSLTEDLSASPLDPELMVELARLKGEALVFLYVGRVMPQKGLKELIHAFRSMPDTRAALWVVGNPIRAEEGRGAVSVAYYDECVALASGDGRVRLFGQVRPDFVNHYYATADVFVHPHVFSVAGREMHEGWGNVVVEAASMSRPIITTDRVASAFDFVLEGTNGFRIDARQLADQLPGRLRYFLENRGAAAKFGGESRRIFERLNDPELSRRAVRDLLETSGAGGR